jgi:hypothetical protein
MARYLSWSALSDGISLLEAAGSLEMGANQLGNQGDRLVWLVIAEMGVVPAGGLRGLRVLAVPVGRSG